ncbi:hypothetical protein K2F43_20645 [Clostridium estertheticum]|uniref:hypothetical protein n=1 Tax=Clostridium estertheticum TaxID=238834 RepID=UPI001C6EFA6C|nr:hypothetical protein [Clostridium estertheticum]MBW9173598.1 hypothetical protein [Clostridium estertheticum]WLC75231.1 hypothetical protein KTC99_21365 [Clostridium estertheticum]
MGIKHLEKLVKYIKEVYKIERGISKLNDKRRNPMYSTGEVILPVLFGFIIRIQSFNELNI